MIDFNGEMDPYLWYSVRIKKMVNKNATMGKISVAYLIIVK